MTRWYTHAAALAVLLGATWAVQAQPGFPEPVGAARMPDPLHYTPGPPPNVVPGPITPEIAPMGPGPELSLDAKHPSAFQLENYPTEEAFYATIGPMALQLQRLPHFQTVFREVTPNPANPPDLTPQQFYPLLPAGARPVLQDLISLRPAMNGGVRTTLGYLLGNQAVELSGFYIIPNAKGIETNERGRLTVPFGTISRAFPIGFEGNNNLWVNADRVRTTHSTQLGNVELNYRLWNSGINHTELIVGVRYGHLQENISIFTDDEAATLSVQGLNDPRRQATYSVTSKNNIVALQFGGEHSAPVPFAFLKNTLWFTLQGKVALGPNFIDRTFALRRGDGLVGFDATRLDTQFGQIYDLSAAFDFHIMDRMRVRAGYQALWLGGISSAAGEVNYDLTRPTSGPLNYSYQFYHGPMLEFQFLF